MTLELKQLEGKNKIVWFFGIFSKTNKVSAILFLDYYWRCNCGHILFLNLFCGVYNKRDINDIRYLKTPCMSSSVLIIKNM